MAVPEAKHNRKGGSSMRKTQDIAWRAPHYRDRSNTNPVTFYQRLRDNNSTTFVTAATGGHGITEVELEDDERIRLMHIAQILPALDSSFFLYLDAPGFLAMKHFNERSNLVISNLKDKLEGCNVYLTMEMLNSQLSPIVASSELFSLFSSPDPPSLRSPQPAAVVGAGMSSSTTPLSVLGAAYGVPIISPSATSTRLESNDAASMFGRTVPTNTGMAEATAAYFKELRVTHVGVLYILDDYGASFQKDLAAAAARYGIKLYSVAFEKNNAESIKYAMVQMKRYSAVRYIYGILHNGSFKGVLEQAYDAGLVGADYVWFLPEIEAITEKGYSLHRRKQAKLIAAIQGAQVFGIRSKKDPAFEQALSSLQYDLNFQIDFLAAHPDPLAYEGVDFRTKTPVISAFSYMAYDAVMALGIATCEADDPFLTGTDLFRQFRNTSFDGASGLVAFDPFTGTRKFETLEYSFTNVFINEALSDDDTVVFQSRISTVIDFNAKHILTELNPVIYNDGTSNRPMAISPVEEELNLVPLGVLICGWIMMGLLVLTCLALSIWIVVNKNKKAVRAAQPAFLCMLIAGTLLMASSILPMTFQEPTPQRGLNFACMATPWLFVLGFSTAFSAIFAKCNRLFIQVQRMMDRTSRETVTPCDVLKPFLVITLTNVALLSSWSVKAPLVWTRVAIENFDSFGRTVESYGTCLPLAAEAELSTALFSALVALNFLVAVFAFFKASQTRNMPSQYNEAYYVSLSIAFMVEGFLLGVPITFLLVHDPLARFLVNATLVAAFCIAILFPIFAPKVWIQRQFVIKESAREQWSEYVAQVQADLKTAQLRKKEKSIRGSSFGNSRGSLESQSGPREKRGSTTSLQRSRREKSDRISIHQANLVHIKESNPIVTLNEDEKEPE